MTFLNSIFLFALGLGLLPLLIHLLNREKVKRIKFSTIEYIRRFQKTKMRRVRLRQILLLILRTIIVLLLVLAFARPALRGFFSSGVGAHAKTTAVVLVDNSYSLSREGPTGDLLPWAKRMALSVLDLLKEGDEVALVLFSDRAEAIPEQLTHNFSRARRVIETLEASPRATDVEKALSLAGTMVTESKNINEEIYLITDLANNGWESLLDGTRDVTIEPDVKIFVLAPSSIPSHNLTLEYVGLKRQLLEANKSIKLSAMIKNYSSTPVEDLLVELFVDGRRRGQVGIDIDPDQSQSALFTFILDEPGLHWGFVEIEDDHLLVDNRRYFTLDIPGEVEVLVVGEKKEDTFYLETALNPFREGDFPVRVTSCFSRELTRFALSDFNVLLLSNVRGLTSEASEAVRKFVLDGGGLFVFLGNDVDPRFYNQDSFGELIPVFLRSPTGNSDQRERYVTMEKIDYYHPVFEGFVENEGDEIISPPFFVVYQADLESGGETLARFSTGFPALVEAIHGRGRVMLMTTAADPQWNDLPTSGLFVPLVHRTVRYLASQPSMTWEKIPVGSRVERSLSLAGNLGEVGYESPRGERIALKPRPMGTQTVVEISDLDSPGIFRIFSDETMVDMFAVNVDTEESNPSLVSEDEARKSLGGNQVLFIPPEANVEEFILQSRYGRELWRQALWLAFGLMVVEVLLGRQRGREDRESQKERAAEEV